MKILIGYDGSDYGKTILDDLKNAGLPAKTEAIVMTVADVREIPRSLFLAETISSQIEHLVSSDSTERFERIVDNHIKMAQADALEIVRRIGKQFPGWRVSAEGAAGKPADELIGRADEMKPDLTVVGSHGRGAIGRLLLGSVSQKILHEAHCSVRICRRNESKKPNSKNRVLIAFDGSDNALAVLAAIASRSWENETEFRIIAVDDPFSRAEAGYINWNIEKDEPFDDEKSREWINKIIKQPKEILKSAGLEVSHKIRWGDAAGMILHEVEDWNADSIFIGARGLGRVKRFLLGSVSSAVAARAHCTVEVVRN